MSEYEYIDVQWTVVCRSSVQALLQAVHARATSLGWLFRFVEITDDQGAAVPIHERWPSGTMGSLTYSKPGSPVEYSHFWDAQSDEKQSQIAGGLYVKQYLSDGECFRVGCDRAIDDLCSLFSSEQVLCVVLTLDDDRDITIAPSIAGRYRDGLWERLPPETLSMNVLSQRRVGDWIEVRPLRSDGDDPLNVAAMPDPVARTLMEVQRMLEAALLRT